VALGRADGQGDLFDDGVRFCEESLPKNSIYRFLARERERLFPDELFADLFCERGRRSVPPSVVATVMFFSTNRGDRVARGVLKAIAEVGIDQVTISRGRPTRALQRRPSLPSPVPEGADRTLPRFPGYRRSALASWPRCGGCFARPEVLAEDFPGQ
jgi:hypothetical protein